MYNTNSIFCIIFYECGFFLNGCSLFTDSSFIVRSRSFRGIPFFINLALRYTFNKNTEELHEESKFYSVFYCIKILKLEIYNETYLLIYKRNINENEEGYIKF